MSKYKKFVSALYTLNIISQAFFTLLFPIGIAAVASYLLVRFAGAPTFIWAILLTVATFLGLFSMVKFVLSAMAALERLEKEGDRRKKENEEMKKKHEELLELTKRKSNSTDD